MPFFAFQPTFWSCLSLASCLYICDWAVAASSVIVHWREEEEEEEEEGRCSAIRVSLG